MQFFLKEAQIMYVPIRIRIGTLGECTNYLLRKNGEGQNDTPVCNPCLGKRLGNPRVNKRTSYILDFMIFFFQGSSNENLKFQ